MVGLDDTDRDYHAENAGLNNAALGVTTLLYVHRNHTTVFAHAAIICFVQQPTNIHLYTYKEKIQ